MPSMKILTIVICLSTFTALSATELSESAKHKHDTSTLSTSICGANCLFALHVIMGDIPHDIGRIARECKHNRVLGISFLDMKNYLVKNKFDVYAERIAAAEINNSNYYIVPIRTDNSLVYNHYILILSRNSNSLKFYDGRGQVKEFSMVDLSEKWDGECLRISKDIKRPDLKQLGMEFVFIGGQQPFYVSKTRITREQYLKFMSDVSKGTFEHSQCWEKDCSRSHYLKNEDVYRQIKGDSITGVSWFDAYAFCKWLGSEYQLPTKKHYQLMTSYNKQIDGPPLVSKDKPEIDGNNKRIPIDGLLTGIKELTLNSLEADEKSGSVCRKVLLFDSERKPVLGQFSFCVDDAKSDEIGFRVVKTR